MLQSYANFALFIESSMHIELNFLVLLALFVINKRKIRKTYLEPINMDLFEARCFSGKLRRILASNL